MSEKPRKASYLEYYGCLIEKTNTIQNINLKQKHDKKKGELP